jgi:hypothetical protein
MYICIYVCTHGIYDRSRSLRLSEGLEERDVLRDATAKGIGVELAGGQTHEEGCVEGENRIVSELDPEPPRRSFFLHHRDPSPRRRFTDRSSEIPKTSKKSPRSENRPVN